MKQFLLKQNKIIIGAFVAVLFLVGGSSVARASATISLSQSGGAYGTIYPNWVGFTTEYVGAIFVGDGGYTKWSVASLPSSFAVTVSTGDGTGYFYVCSANFTLQAPPSRDCNNGESTLLGTLTYTLSAGVLVSQSYDLIDFDTTTHFINISPQNGTTTATTTLVGATLFANIDDFPNYGRLHLRFSQDSEYVCQNSGAVYDALFTCEGENWPAPPFEIDLSTTTLDRILAGDYTLLNNITFAKGGKWTGVYEIQQVSSPWYYFGLTNSYNTILSTTTHFTVGLPSPMDIVIQEVREAQEKVASTTAHGIGSILSSTTASWKSACNPFSGLGFNFSFSSVEVATSTFDVGDCITLTFWPGSTAMGDNFMILKQTPPWGYVFRIIDILNATTSTSTLPSISYSFASTSPMAVMGDIHFDPFGSMQQSATLVNEMHSDRESGATVWTIMMPIVNIFVYLVLGFMIVHDLTGIHSQDVSKRSKDNENKKV